MSFQWDFYLLGAMVTGLVAFVATWAVATAAYGAVGFLLGWLPALVVGAIVGYLWPVLAIGVFLFILWLP